MYLNEIIKCKESLILTVERDCSMMNTIIFKKLWIHWLHKTYSIFITTMKCLAVDK